MGQKTQPIGFRLGINRTWDSRWFGGKAYADLLHQDIGVRKYLFDKLKSAAVSKIVIERPAGRARITIYAGRPGLVIGKKGQDIETLKKTKSKQIGAEVILNIIQIINNELD
jgi:small subunit ribosomal protein S3